MTSPGCSAYADGCIASRWQFFLPAAVLVAGYWFHALHQHQWGSPDFILASLLAALSVLATIREQACRSILVILRKVGTLNRLSVMSSVTRLLLTIFAIWLLAEGFNLWGMMAATLLATLLVLLQLANVPAISAFSTAELVDEDERQG